MDKNRTQEETVYTAFFHKNAWGRSYPSDPYLMDDIYLALDMMMFLLTEEPEQKNYPTQEVVARSMEQAILHIKSRIENTMEKGSLRLIELSRKFSLSDWQLFCILLGGACCHRAKYQNIFATLQGDARCQFATKGLAYELFGTLYPVEPEQHREMLKDSGFWRQFFERTQEYEDVLSGLEQPMKLKQQVFDYLWGVEDIPVKLREGTVLYDGSIEPEEQKGYEQERERLLRLWSRKDRPHVVISGRRGSGRRLLVKHMSFLLKQRILFVDAGFLSEEEEGAGRLEMLCLEASLRDACICLTEEKPQPQLGQLIGEISCRGHSLLLVTEQLPDSRLQGKRSWVSLSMPRPNGRMALKLWQHFLKSYKSDKLEPEELSGMYNLEAGETKEVLENAFWIAQSSGRDFLETEDIAMAVKQKNGRALENYAQLLCTGAKWEDLVLEPETARQLLYIKNRLRYKNLVGGQWGFDEKNIYGRGICALFYGPSGTGKTMAVNVLANELGLELYRVDLSQMVSKYIGETQKHISQLFDRAKGINALLFFDEADALFARRTGVGDAKDRHANSEVAHLLQKLEEYEGLSILATNLKDNIDDAFKRRIKYMVRFSLPDAKTREILWEKALPKAAPVEEDLDLKYFGEHFELSGSEIKDAMLQGAFLAAQEHSAIGNRHLVEAVRLCFAKYGKVLSQEELGYLA